MKKFMQKINENSNVRLAEFIAIYAMGSNHSEVQKSMRGEFSFSHYFLDLNLIKSARLEQVKIYKYVRKENNYLEPIGELDSIEATAFRIDKTDYVGIFVDYCDKKILKKIDKIKKAKAVIDRIKGQ